MTYGIPTNDGKTVSAVFGRAKSFAIFENEDANYIIVPNEGYQTEHGAGTGAVSLLVQKGITTVIAPEIGPKATQALEAAGISIKNAEAGIPLGVALAGTLGV
jgi:predicted Fe-Mo cluster-binding NifX family protein